MRVILFRGKRVYDGEWLQGYYKSCGIHVGTIEEEIYPTISEFGNPLAFEVIPETVGQFTGLKDKNGKKIFEGDIIESDNGKQSAISVVKFGEYYPEMFYKMLDMFSPGKRHLPANGFYAESVDKHEEMILFQSPCVTIIGNIYDNPELLEVTDNA